MEATDQRSGLKRRLHDERIAGSDKRGSGVVFWEQSADDPKMPFKSQAQRRKFAQLLVEGKISNQTYEEWNRETGGKKLPERVKPKRTTKKTAQKSRKTVARKRK